MNLPVIARSLEGLSESRIKRIKGLRGKKESADAEQISMETLSELAILALDSTTFKEMIQFQSMTGIYFTKLDDI